MLFLLKGKVSCIWQPTNWAENLGGDPVRDWQSCGLHHHWSFSPGPRPWPALVQPLSRNLCAKSLETRTSRGGNPDQEISSSWPSRPVTLLPWAHALLEVWSVHSIQRGLTPGSYHIQSYGGTKPEKWVSSGGLILNSFRTPWSIIHSLDKFIGGLSNCAVGNWALQAMLAMSSPSETGMADPRGGALDPTVHSWTNDLTSLSLSTIKWG